MTDITRLGPQQRTLCQFSCGAASPWLQSLSGAAVPLLAPTPADVRWRDIAESLGRLCRFGGHVLPPHYSVAQHCLVVADLVAAAIRRDREAAALTLAACRISLAGAAVAAMALAQARQDDTIGRRLTLAALIHDAHEAHLGDITSPVMAALATEVGDGLLRLKARHDAAIYPAAGLPWPLPAGWGAVIAAADLVALATERRDLLAPSLCPWPEPSLDPAPLAIKAFRADLATDQWLWRLGDLMPLRTAFAP